MSGVYIPNMELPEDCESCLFMKTDLSGEITYCPITRRPVRWWMHDLQQSSEGHCPLVPEPEHGRLGDLDELVEKFKTELTISPPQKIENSTLCCAIGFDGVERIINIAPTIIPADPVKEGE